MTDMANPSGDPVSLSHELVQDWFAALERIAGREQLAHFLEAAGVAPAMLARPGARIAGEQIIAFYQIAAVATGDEMMGLWSRPIRSGSLKLICRSLIGAPSMATALNRLAQVWSLLLDDYQLVFTDDGGEGVMTVAPRAADAPLNRFGQALMLKLAHGVASWLAGQEVPLAGLRLAFPRPSFAADYAMMFPRQPEFGGGPSAIAFTARTLAQPILRKEAEVQAFLERAPRDWLFTTSMTHLLALRVRHFLYAGPHGFQAGLAETAAHLALSRRSLARRLAAEGASFQQIKDRLRRDTAMRRLAQGREKIDALALELGFTAAPVFHRSFRSWTGMTPAQYRRMAQASRGARASVGEMSRGARASGGEASREARAPVGEASRGARVSGGKMSRGARAPAGEISREAGGSAGEAPGDA
ncbi:AraC family transcriptional regulator ligand-binding domain-containing protein [Camelimonas sp. ID_303_24]